MNKPAQLWWLVLFVFFLLLLVLALVVEPPSATPAGSSYDPSPHGFRAAYVLLEELGYPVTRSKRLSGGEVRLVIFPLSSQEEAGALDSWVRAGGILILADDSTEFARKMGIQLRIQHGEEDSDEEAAAGLGVSRLAGGEAFVAWPDHEGEVLAEAGFQPAVTAYRRGEGELWLVNRPAMLFNNRIGKADNSVLLCRLADRAFARKQGPLIFDEYFHGMRDRPGSFTLLWQPPVLWVTVQVLLAMGILLWQQMPRFGPLRPAADFQRRSQEEFLDALASLLDRKGDYVEALATVRTGLLHELERELGLPGGAPIRMVSMEAARRRSGCPTLLRLLAADSSPGLVGRHQFLEAMNEWENAREEFFGERTQRQPGRAASPESHSRSSL